MRANAFHCRKDNPHQTRDVPWPFAAGGDYPLIKIDGANFEISDSDIWSTWTVFMVCPDRYVCGAFGSLGRDIKSARYGQIVRNTVWNGGSCYWFDAGQILWEDNTCTGNSPEAMGTGVMEWSGGYTHNFYVGSSSIRQVWGNDREVMTFDGESPCFYGHVVNVSTDGLTFRLDHALPGTNVQGGVLVVLNGTGAAQSRRLVSNTTDSVTVDRPLDVPVGNATIGVMPFRGRSIFYRNTFEDVGAFQTYGTGMDVIAYGNSMARGGGFVAWGQFTPNEGGHFVHPNMRVQFIGNDVTEGNRAEHQGTPLGMGDWGPQLQNGGAGFSVFGHSDPSTPAHPEVNRLIDFRRNRVLSNGGFQIGPGIDIVVSGNSVANTPRESIVPRDPYVVDPAALGVLLRDNVSPVEVVETQTLLSIEI